MNQENSFYPNSHEHPPVIKLTKNLQNRTGIAIFKNVNLTNEELKL